ncbi:hypothetical protein Hdeb2414_s0140g00810521 [Helianthus debilis subsp. tardiflorus]
MSLCLDMCCFVIYLSFFKGSKLNKSPRPDPNDDRPKILSFGCKKSKYRKNWTPLKKNPGSATVDT